MMAENGEVKGSLYRTEVIAQLFGVSVRRVQQLTQEGIISTTKILEDGHTVRRYDLVPTIQSYIKYLSEKAYGKAGRSEKEVELREQKMKADVALKESQGELHRLKTEIAAGKYISIEEVKLDYAKFFVAFKKFAASLPSRIIGMLSGGIDPCSIARKWAPYEISIVSVPADPTVGVGRSEGDGEPGKTSLEMCERQLQINKNLMEEETDDNQRND